MKKQIMTILVMSFFCLLIFQDMVFASGDIKIKYIGISGPCDQYDIFADSKKIGMAMYPIGHKAFGITEEFTGAQYMFMHKNGYVQDATTREVISNNATSKAQAVKVAAEHWAMYYYSGR